MDKRHELWTPLRLEGKMAEDFRDTAVIGMLEHHHVAFRDPLKLVAASVSRGLKRPLGREHLLQLGGQALADGVRPQQPDLRVEVALAVVGQSVYVPDRYLRATVSFCIYIEAKLWI